MINNDINIKKDNSIVAHALVNLRLFENFQLQATIKSFNVTNNYTIC
tara:strand:- start:67562 stop:67702 length:141 start_codon:yes stop_codon:yes gene_type:complete